MPDFQQFFFQTWAWGARMLQFWTSIMHRVDKHMQTYTEKWRHVHKRETAKFQGSICPQNKALRFWNWQNELKKWAINKSDAKQQQQKNQDTHDTTNHNFFCKLCILSNVFIIKWSKTGKNLLCSQNLSTSQNHKRGMGGGGNWWFWSKCHCCVALKQDPSNCAWF